MSYTFPLMGISGGVLSTMNKMDKYPIKSPDTASRIIDKEAVVVIPGKNIVNIFNKVGSLIWELTDGKRSIRDIGHIISEEFDVSADKACHDAARFIEELEKKGVVEIKDNGSLSRDIQKDI